MIKRLFGVLLLIILALSLITPQHVAARPPSMTISFQPQIIGPDAEGAYNINGTYTVSGLEPINQSNNYLVTIFAEFIGPGGIWSSTSYDSQDVSKGCMTRGGSCISYEEQVGDTLGSFNVHKAQLTNNNQDGMPLEFGGKVWPPPGATEMRIVAQLENRWGSGSSWDAFSYAWAVHRPLPLSSPNQVTNTPNIQHTPIHTPDAPDAPDIPETCSCCASPMITGAAFLAFTGLFIRYNRKRQPPLL